jgi:putative oxidoreductase
MTDCPNIRRGYAESPPPVNRRCCGARASVSLCRMRLAYIRSWRSCAVLVARMIFAAAFLLAASLKLAGMGETAAQIAAAGFPMPSALAWLAAGCELLLVLGFVTGVLFVPTALLAAAYVLFLAFAFHGPARWQDNEAEFGFFVDHFTFVAGLLYAAAYGPGRFALRHVFDR